MPAPRRSRRPTPRRDDPAPSRCRTPLPPLRLLSVSTTARLDALMDSACRTTSHEPFTSPPAAPALAQGSRPATKPRLSPPANHAKITPVDHRGRYMPHSVSRVKPSHLQGSAATTILNEAPISIPDLAER